VYRPRFLGHRIEPYAAFAAGDQVPLVLYFVKPAAAWWVGSRGDDLEAHMARDLDSGQQLGQLEDRHENAREIAQPPPAANPWRVERADLRRVEGKAPIRGLRERGHFSRRDWLVYAVAVAITIAAAVTAAFVF
jgi:hypothetical protein